MSRLWTNWFLLCRNLDMLRVTANVLAYTRTPSSRWSWDGAEAFPEPAISEGLLDLPWAMRAGDTMLNSPVKTRFGCSLKYLPQTEL